MLDWTDALRSDALDSGSGAPSGDPGVKWAKYLDTATGDVYTWDGADWVKTGALPVGGGGGGSAGTEYTEDAAAAANPVGGAVILVRRDTLSASEVSADGDNIAWKATNKGEGRVNDADAIVAIGGVTESAPGTDIASSGLNGRLQRIAQRLTSLIALLPASLGAGGGLKVDGSGTALPVSSTTLATAAKQDTLDSDLTSRLGEVQASPTSNTVLDRLKQLYTALTGTLNVSITDAAAQAAPGAGSAYGTSKSLKGSAGYLLGFSVHNKSTTTLYVALYNATSKTGTALMYWPVYGHDTLSVSFGDIGLYLDTGIFLQGLTDDDGTDTNVGTSDLKFMGRAI